MDIIVVKRTTDIILSFLKCLSIRGTSLVDLKKIGILSGRLFKST